MTCTPQVHDSYKTSLFYTVFISFVHHCTTQLHFFFFFLMIRPPPRSTLFPYPTLFRSDSFPNGKYAFSCEWRIAWVAYLNRQPDADDRLTTFLLKYPVSANSVDALYWLGRNAERGGNPTHARSYYSKAVERFPQTYFGNAAAARLAKLGPGDEDLAELLEKIPPAPSLRSFDEPIPVAAADRWARAQALRAIAFDSSAEQELKNAYFATSSPRLLLEAAQAAFDQGHYRAGMAYARIVVPNFDSRKISDLPVAAWKALYPLPYEAALRREAAKNDFDPMFAAGLIRQESTFQADAVSHANAIGLMQVLPKTGKLLAKQLKVRYTKNKLFEPDYNIELGMVYRSEEHTSELQSQSNLVCRLLLEKKNFGLKMLTMTNLSTECLIQLTKLGYDATPFKQILKQNAKREMRFRLGKVTVADVLAAQPVTTNLLKFMRASIKMIGVSNLQSFIASMTQKLTLSDFSYESKNYLDKAVFPTACLRIKSKWTAGGK